MRRLLTFAIFMLCGCVSTSQVLETGGDGFTVSATSDGFRSAAAARESAFQTGAERCKAMGKHFILVNETSERTRMGIDTAITVCFRCVKEGGGDSGS
jgi:hypothetical protein